MSTWILQLESPRTGLRVAVKDLIDVAGAPTTAGSRVVASCAEPASSDAACLGELRRTGAAIVGKTNLHELACGGTGVNPYFGTPRNPYDSTLIPGGSSSGNAVALAEGEVDLAIGTDSAGSIRTPSACCGTAGLKPTWGRIPMDGIWPLSPSLDVVGPMARDVAGVMSGMMLLDPGFTSGVAAPAIARIRLPGVAPEIDQAIDDLLAVSELEVVEAELVGWQAAGAAAWTVLLHELWNADRGLYARDAAGLGADVRQRIAQGSQISLSEYRRALSHRPVWRAELATAFAVAPVLAWPTVSFFPPRIDGPTPNTAHTNIGVNFAGHPSLALPVPATRLPASVQLVGPDNSEAVLCATGLVLEAALA